MRPVIVSDFGQVENTPTGANEVGLFSLSLSVSELPVSVVSLVTTDVDEHALLRARTLLLNSYF